jgi:hypothetical protein
VVYRSINPISIFHPIVLEFIRTLEEETQALKPHHSQVMALRFKLRWETFPHESIVIIGSLIKIALQLSPLGL